MKEKLISVKDLQKYYPVKKSNPFAKKHYIKAVDGIDIDIFKGETFGLVGESGCGKSTTGHMLVNLLQPTAGQILYQGHDISKGSAIDRKQARKSIQIVFQDPFTSLNPKKKIGWLLTEPLVIHKTHKNTEERNESVTEMLHMVGLDDSYKDRYPHQLSGGQRQRVSIAIALMLRPDFIVADEPTSALDVSVQAQILNLLKTLQAELNLTYLFISHDLNVVQYISDRIGVMYMGKIVELGSVKDIYENPLHPYTQALLSAIPSINKTNCKERIVLHGDPPNPANLPSGCPFHPRCFKAQSVCSVTKPKPIENQAGRKVYCHFS